MSSEKVRNFLKEESKQETELGNIELAQQKFRILSHYDLGEKVYWKEGDDIDCFPLDDNTGPFKYVCDISDEDFKKVQKIYENENNKSVSDGVFNSAEKTLGLIALLLLVAGFIAFIALWIAAAEVNVFRFEWSLFGIGIGIFISSMVNWAFIRVFINISIKLNKLGK